MITQDAIFNGIFIIAGIFMVIYYSKRKHTIKSAFCGMAGGGTALIILHYFGENIGYAPPVNLFNTAVSLIFGIPGTFLIMAVNMIK